MVISTQGSAKVGHFLPVAVLMVSMTFFLPAQAAVWHVNAASTAPAPNGQTWAAAYPTIQPAVDAAASGDEVWVAAGTYTGTGNRVVTLRTDITLYGGFLGTETARTQRDWTANPTIIEGEKARGCVNAEDSRSTVDGFTLQNGKSDGGGGMSGGNAVNCTFSGNRSIDPFGGPSYGGGMYRGTAANCFFSGNTTEHGGGMYGGTAANCTFSGNTAEDGGGTNDVTATNCTFAGNSAPSGGGGMYGGTAVNCTFSRNISTRTDDGPTGTGGGMLGGTAINCTFAGNTADWGGGIYGGTGANDCVFMENSAKGFGGGMAAGMAINCTFTGNSAPKGGGMWNGTATNCLFIKNSATDNGGGVSLSTTVNCTITGNTATSNGGGMHGGTATNCVIWGNTSSEAYDATVSYSCLSVPWAGPGNIVADPLFVEAAAANFQLQSASRCIDAGTGTGVPSTDMLGVPRPQGANYDMGAYEAAVLTTVPELSGLARTAARDLIAAAVLYVGRETEEFNATVPIDQVFGQSPAAGVHVAQRTQVDLIISKGRPVVVPDVVGLARTAARELVAAAQLHVASETEGYHPTVPADQVVRQNPAAGCVVTLNSPVDLVISLGLGPEPVAGVWYVNVASIADNRDGKSWATAYQSIQSAVDAAAAGEELWVAAGTYTGAGTEVVILKAGLTLYGGFAGTESVREQRDWTANPTIIDGQWARRCITAEVSSTVDGFTIQHGGAPTGAGMLGGVAANCTFTVNMTTGADGYGGGMSGGTATNCIFSGNRANFGGGLCNSTATNCTILGNWTSASTVCYPPYPCSCSTSPGRGGGMSGGVAVNCVFSGNQSNLGGAMNGGTAVNCTFFQNEANNYQDFSGCGQQEVAGDGGAMAGGTATNCILWQNTPDDVLSNTTVTYSCLSVVMAGVGNIAAVDPLFADAPARNFRLLPGSPCIDAGTGDGAPATDMAGTSRPQGVGYDMGAYELVQVAVPDLSGLARTAAHELVVAAHLYVHDENEAYHPAVPADHIISQAPAAGVLVLLDSPVDLMISKGPEPVPVPDVIGKTQEAATVAVTEAGLVVGTVTQEYSATVPVGAVLTQMPAAGTQVLPGTPVNLAVSRGVQPSVMPEVAGQARAQAEAAVADAGLTLGLVTEAYSGTVAAGVVISQSPAAGTELAPGTAVSLVVSLGPAPLVEGEGEPVDADTARQALSEAYDRLDTNSDGTLSLCESVAAVPGLTQAVFNELDTDANGELSEDELGMEDGSGCAGCRSGKAALGSSRLSELFLLGLGALGLAVMSTLRRP